MQDVEPCGACLVMCPGGSWRHCGLPLPHHIVAALGPLRPQTAELLCRSDYSVPAVVFRPYAPRRAPWRPPDSCVDLAGLTSFSDGRRPLPQRLPLAVGLRRRPVRLVEGLRLGKHGGFPLSPLRALSTRPDATRSAKFPPRFPACAFLQGCRELRRPDLALRVGAGRFELPTFALSERCTRPDRATRPSCADSRIRTCGLPLMMRTHYACSAMSACKSERRDLNSRPRGPEPRALPG